MRKLTDTKEETKQSHTEKGRKEQGKKIERNLRKENRKENMIDVRERKQKTKLRDAQKSRKR